MPREPSTFPASTPNAPPIALARIGKVTGEGDRVDDSDWVDVHFNPASLQLQVSNELKDQPNLERKQYVAKTSAKLTMDLQFDTTDTGVDVMRTTSRIQAFIAPPLPDDDRARQQIPPPLVMFEWGTLRFKGIVESYRETIDFFSADGVPLRASVNLTLSRQDQVFDPASGRDPADVGRPNEADLFDLPATSASDAAEQGGDPSANRNIASVNGQENLRFGSKASLTVGSGVTLKPPAAFSSGGGGLSLGADAGVGLSLKLSGSAAGGVASQARLSATEGAFGSLRPNVTAASTPRLDTGKLVPKPSGSGVSTGTGASFQAGGRARQGGPAGLRTEVGAGANLSFDAD